MMLFYSIFFYHYLDDSNKVVNSFLLSSRDSETAQKYMSMKNVFKDTLKSSWFFFQYLEISEFVGGKKIYFSVIFVDILAFPVWL